MKNKTKYVIMAHNIKTGWTAWESTRGYASKQIDAWLSGYKSGKIHGNDYDRVEAASITEGDDKNEQK